MHQEIAGSNVLFAEERTNTPTDHMLSFDTFMHTNAVSGSLYPS